MASSGASPPVVYHLVEKPLWDKFKAEEQPYFPPTYEADGFTHLTKNPSLLLEVANHFYKDVTVPFLCLACAEDKLTAEVKYEAPAAVGDKEAMSKDEKEEGGGGGDATSALQCPHLYGPINLDAVIAELQVTRTEDGTFTTIEEFGK